MPENLKPVLKSLHSEIKKDFLFFVACSFVVGLSMILQFYMVGNNQSTSSWFASFMPFGMFFSIYFGYLFVAVVATIVASLGYFPVWLEFSVRHVEERFTQVTSAVVSFIFGALTFIVLLSVFFWDFSGISLLVMLFFCLVFVVVSFVIAVAMGRRINPFDTWYFALLVMVFIFFALFWLLMKGEDILLPTC